MRDTAITPRASPQILRSFLCSLRALGFSIFRTMERKQMATTEITITAQRRALGFINAVRIQESFTASAERRILRSLAERMPAGINSDHLTALGFAAQLGAGAAFALARWNRFALL